MTSRAQTRRRASARVRRRRRLAVTITIVAVLVVAIGATVFALTRGEATTAAPAADPAAATSPSAPPPTPADAAAQLLATSTDPAACAVEFDGDGISLDPQLQTEGTRYAALPIPRADGRVFAGWYATAADAAAANSPARINGSKAVACTDRRTTLYAGWKTPEQNTAEATRVPIVMYHQFTTNPEGENNSLRGNYAYIGDFDAQMAYVSQSGFYLPTWDELSAFIDGELFLPQRSVIITDDDADRTWLELAAPIVEKYKVMTTSFVITKWRSEPTPNMYVQQRSHTQEMHEPGADGRGRMVNWTVDQIAADLETSAQVLGAKEIVAYPFGHVNDTAKQGVLAAGYEMARTTDQGYVSIGTDKLALPCIRMNYGMNLDALKGLIG